MANWRERGYVPDSDDDEEDRDGAFQSVKNHAILAPEHEPIHGPSPAQRATTNGHDTLPDAQDITTEQNVGLPSSHGDCESLAQDGTNKLTVPHVDASHPQLFAQPDDIPTSTVARLEAEIQKGLKTVQDVLGSLPSPLDSDNDSPLSSAPSSPSIPWQSPAKETLLGFPAPAHVNDDNGSPAPAPAHRGRASWQTPLSEMQRAASAEVSVPRTQASGVLLPMALDEAPRKRSFRPRAPIQVHPYALEDARYRQTWTARGLKPLRAPEATSNPPGTPNEESQDTTAYQSSQTDLPDNLIRSASAAMDIPQERSSGTDNEESQSPIPGVRVRHHSPMSDLNDDLLDLSEIFKSRTTTLTSLKPKKSKHASLNKSRPGKDGFQIYDLPDDDPIIHHPSKAHRRNSMTPLSPPRSRGGLSSQDGMLAHTAHVQIGNSTPTLLPTPVVSSDKHASKRTFAALFDDADSESDVVDMTNESAASSSSGEISNDESQGVQHMRRKIKGVLPASWLKLDMKQRHEPARTVRHPVQSPVKNVLEKGIAKRVSSSARESSDRVGKRAVQENVADLDTSSESGSELHVDEMDDVQYDLPEAFGDDVVEDNAIDAMLAPRVRMPPVGKRQQRLSGAWSKKKTEKSSRAVSRGAFTFPRASNIKVTSKSKKEARPLKKVKRKHRTRQVTILDAPGFEERDVPLFLRIASRRTGDTRTARKQDLSKKFFRLATIKDTEDVNNGLRGWRGSQGQLRSTVESSKGPKSRSALVSPQRRRFDSIDIGNPSTSARDGQRHLRNGPEFEPQLIALKQTTRTTLERIRTNETQTHWLLGINANTNPAVQAPVILDYFQPGISHRAQLKPRKLSRIEQDPGEHPEPRLTQSKPFVLQRRVPQSARTRRERRNHTAPREFSTIADTQPQALLRSPPGQVDPCQCSGDGNTDKLSRKRQDLPFSLALPSRPPRKQQPVDLRIRNDAAFHQRDILYLQSFDLDSERDIITNATRYPPCGSSLPNTAFRSGTQPVRSNLILLTLPSMDDTARLFEPQWLDKTVRTPKTQRTLEASGWSPAVEAILRDALTETFNITCRDVATSALSTSEKSDLLSRAVESVETIVTYVNTTLNFSSEQELEAFLQLTSELIGKIWRGIAECEAAISGSHATGVLKILNGLLVLGYQLDQCAKVLASSEVIRIKIEESRKNLARLAWDLALQEEHIGQLFAYIAAQPCVDKSLATQSSNYAAGVETILFIHTFGPHHGWSFYMQDILATDANASETHLLQSRAESLAYAVLVLGCILSVAGSEGLSSRQDKHPSTNLGFSLRGMLVSKVSEFLKPYIEHKAKYGKRFINKSVHVRKLEQFGLIMVRWCLLLIRNFLHDLADDLLKALFKYYSECGMVELFGRSVHTEMDRMPQFLKDQVPSRDLIPEEGDSDFHIFLKLAAITLMAEPLADGRAAEQTRKLNLRKKSLLFLLLPNKGRDLAVDDLSLFDEDKDLALTDFAGIANRYSLFATLYHYAPDGSKPAISQLSNYVDFPTAHEHVREVILGCWANIVKSVLSQSANGTGLHELGQWIREMLFAVCEKLASIPKDVNVADQDEILRAQYHVHRINRKITITCVSHVAARYTTAINLCANEDQVSYLLPREEVSGLILRCYVDHDLGDVVVRQVFDLLTSYIKKGLQRDREVLRLFRQDLRGLLVDQLTRNKQQDGLDFELLLGSMTEAWYALGKVMVSEGSAHWHQFLNDGSAMSFPQIADVHSGRHCQVLLMSKIAVERTLVVADPYPFMDLLLRSILNPAAAGSEITFVHRLLNQLMESIPDVFMLDVLRQNLSNGITPFFLDKLDIINHRLAIVDHFIRYAYVLRVAAEVSPVTDLTDGQWNELTKLIYTLLKRTANGLNGETQSEWMAFAQKLLFRLNLYTGSGSGSDSWSIEANGEEVESNAFRLERLFVRLLSPSDPIHLDNQRAAKAFRSALESACRKTKEEDLVKHLVIIFGAADPDYVDDDGSFLLNIPQQIDFMKAIFPVYIGSALDVDQPTSLFAIPVLDIAAGILRMLEARVDLESQACMESFAELISVLMRTAVWAMQRSIPLPLTDGSWQVETIRRLGDLCSLCGGRWMHIHQLFPTSASILAVQPHVQAYAYYAYEYTSAAAGSDASAIPSNSTSWEGVNTFERWTADFGFEIEEMSLPEHIVALKNAALDDLRAANKDWHRAGFTACGPVWELRRGASPAVVRANRRGVRDGTSLTALRQAVARLERVLNLLGVMEEVL